MSNIVYFENKLTIRVCFNDEIGSGTTHKKAHLLAIVILDYVLRASVMRLLQLTHPELKAYGYDSTETIKGKYGI